MSGSPLSVTCDASEYGGKLETASCNTVGGWAWDKNHPDRALVVELMEGSTVHATVTADIYNEARKNAGYGTGKYNFSIPLPANLKDGSAHQLSIRIKGTNIILSGSPRTITCQAVSARLFASSNIIEESNSESNSPIDLVVGPNPSSGELLLTYSSISSQISSEISIYNLLGQIVWQQTNVETSEINQLKIDLRAKPAGVYLLKFQRGEEIKVKRIALVR